MQAKLEIIILLRFYISGMPPSQEKPASFIGKLCNILRSKEHAKIICWDSQQKGIRVLNQKKLEEVILPRYYRHNRYSSFVRQLNMYDFHKIYLPDHRSIFLHSTFDPKKKENIHLIRRKVTFQQKSSQDKQPDRRMSEIVSQKENSQICDAFFKSSKNMLYKNSIINFFTEKHSNLQELSQGQVLQELTKQLLPLKEKKELFESRYKELKTNKKYRRFFKTSKFRHELSLKLGVDSIEGDDGLSQLSIEDQLMFKTKKSLSQKSLRLLESGQIYFRKETIGNLLNI